jgi:hypothetical protein
MDTQKLRKKNQRFWIDKEGPNLNLWFLGNGKYVHFPDGIPMTGKEVDNYLRNRGFVFNKENDKDSGFLADGNQK